MGLGLYIIMAWIGVVIASCVIAGIHLARKHAKGIWPAIIAIAGALLSWALVSAYIGAFEINNYVESKAFLASLGIGIAGLVLVIASCSKLKRTTNKAAAIDA